MMAAIRSHLAEQDFLEVETPLRIPAPALEDYIDAEPAGNHWLRTSPELHMKRLLAAGYPKIFQIGPCFRMGECGSRHLPEFTMLEWYSLQSNYRDLLAETVRLVRQVLSQTLGRQHCEFRGEQIDFSKDWEELTVDAAFACYTDMDVDTAIELGKFEEILVEHIEPNLGHGHPTVLIDYPLACSGLSRAIPGQPNRVERWEIYVSGLELANACSELINFEEQQSRFAECRQLRAAEQRDVYPDDQPFLDALAAGLPPCAGIAIGLDRLLMILANSDSIQETVAFPSGEATIR